VQQSKTSTQTASKISDTITYRLLHLSSYMKPNIELKIFALLIKTQKIPAPPTAPSIKEGPA
jgi:hypothetical protein